VVLTAAMESWPDTLFDFDRLETMFGGQTVRIYRLPQRKRARRMSSVNNNFYIWSDDKPDPTTLKQCTFGNFLSSLRRGRAGYCMANSTKNSRLRQLLLAQAGSLALGLTDGRVRGSTGEFFFGSAGASPGLHHDGPIESFLCQLIGAKQVNVFSPLDISFLYPAGSWVDQLGHFSLVSDSFRGGGRRFPRFRQATKYTCRLEPGDVLYVPPHWYHDPMPEGPGVTLTLRKAPPAGEWGIARNNKSLKRAVTRLYETLGRYSPVARAAYRARLLYDLTNEDDFRRRRRAFRGRVRS
jgi:hypothetical protein